MSTAVAPSWTEIGKLGAIAIIRTALNYFLGKEMKEEQAGERTIAEKQVENQALGKIGKTG